MAIIPIERFGKVSKVIGVFSAACEEPYNNLYSRVTTKSNAFTVYWRAQTLRRAPGSPVGSPDEARELAASELLGPRSWSDS